MSRSGFAAQLGLHPSGITRLLKRQIEASPELARRIFEATAGEVTPNDLILSTGYRPPVCTLCDRRLDSDGWRNCQFDDCPQADREAA